MKKLIITSLVALATTTGFASDYYTEETTTTTTEQVQVTNESYYVNHRPYQSTYCQYKDDHGYCNKLAPRYEYNLKPVTVYTGKTVTVQKHYDVYQPKVIYQKVNSYTTTQTCEYCK